MPKMANKALSAAFIAVLGLTGFASAFGAFNLASDPALGGLRQAMEAGDEEEARALHQQLHEQKMAFREALLAGDYEAATTVLEESGREMLLSEELFGELSQKANEFKEARENGGHPFLRRRISRRMRENPHEGIE